MHILNPCQRGMSSCDVGKTNSEPLTWKYPLPQLSESNLHHVTWFLRLIANRKVAEVRCSHDRFILNKNHRTERLSTWVILWSQLVSVASTWQSGLIRSGLNSYLQCSCCSWWQMLIMCSDNDFIQFSLLASSRSSGELHQQTPRQTQTHSSAAAFLRPQMY